MKACIWCKKDENEVTFKKQAHTIPQSLGGKEICENVCDSCNHYFGAYENQIVSVETALKETFNVSRARLLEAINEVGKNKGMSRYKSTFFTINFEKGEIKPKPKYNLTPNFQKNLSRQFKRGIYKIFLEELERQKSEGHNSRYEFIRKFARYNQGTLPLFYFERKFGIILQTKDQMINPKVHFRKEEKSKYLFLNDDFFEFEILGHVISIPISKNAESNFEGYIKDSMELKKRFFKGLINVKNFSDIDFTLRILNDRQL